MPLRRDWKHGAGTASVLVGRCATDSLRAESCDGACTLFRYGGPSAARRQVAFTAGKISAGALLGLTAPFSLVMISASHPVHDEAVDKDGAPGFV